MRAFSRVFLGTWLYSKGDCRWCVGWEVETLWRMAPFLLLGRVSKWLPITQRLFPPRTAVVSAVDEEKIARFLYGLFSQPAVSLWMFFFFFIAFINNSKIITGRQLWKYCTKFWFLDLLVFLVHSFKFWNRWLQVVLLRCALLRSWLVSPRKKG